VDSSQEQSDARNLEARITEAIESPEKVERYGLLCLGLSDDAVNDVSFRRSIEGGWRRLIPNPTGSMELPVWVDHVGSAKTRWQRYDLDQEAASLSAPPDDTGWGWTEIRSPAFATK